MRTGLVIALLGLAGVLPAEAGVITFTDFTAEAGTTAVELSVKSALLDLEEDGDLDLVVWSTVETEDHLYRNDGTAHFEDVTAMAGLAGLGGELGGAIADFDNDSFPDMVVATARAGIPNLLYRNLDGLRFAEVGGTVGIGENVKSAGPSWTDLNRDGQLDFYMGTIPGGLPGEHPFLYINQQNSHFLDEWETRGLDFTGNGQTHLWFDWEDDGDSDLFIGVFFDPATDNMRDRIYRNDGTGSFTLATNAVNASPVVTDGVQLVDFDADSQLDIFVLQTVEPNLFDEPPPVMNVVWRDNGDGTFTDIAAQLNLEMPANVIPSGPRDEKQDVVVADFDNDMDPDLFVALWNARIGGEPSNELWLNEGGVYVDRTIEAGLVQPINSNSCTAGDVNGDGFLDIYVTNDNGGGSRDTLWLNNGNANHWFEIDPQGVVSNRDGIGMRAWVTAGGITQVQELYSTPTLPLRLHFGLASHEVVESLTLRWPNGLVETYSDLPADQVFRPIEGAATPFEGTGVTLR